MTPCPSGYKSNVASDTCSCDGSAAFIDSVSGCTDNNYETEHCPAAGGNYIEVKGYNFGNIDTVNQKNNK